MQGNKTQGLWKIFLNGCLLGVLSIFFIWSFHPTKNLSDTIIKGNHNSGYHTFLSHGNGAFYRIPVSPKENSTYLEITNESEDDIQLEDFDLRHQAAYFISVPHYLLLDKILSVLPVPFFLNRTTVPLFILHRSWKNFLH
jgi:hypothetical protein